MKLSIVFVLTSAILLLAPTTSFAEQRGFENGRCVCAIAGKTKSGRIKYDCSMCAGGSNAQKSKSKPSKPSRITPE